MILTVLLWVVGVVVAILAALILTPIRVHARVSTSPRLRYRVEVRVLGGMAPRFAFTSREGPRKPKLKKLAPKKKKRKKAGIRLYGGGKASAILDLIGGILAAIHFEHLKLDTEFGLPDPADTGQIYGFLTPLQFALPLPQDGLVTLRPNFAEACLKAEADAALRFTVAALFPPVARFAWRVMGPGS